MIFHECILVAILPFDDHFVNPSIDYLEQPTCLHIIHAYIIVYIKNEGLYVNVDIIINSIYKRENIYIQVDKTLTMFSRFPHHNSILS